MAQEELEIEISPSGKVTVRTVGIKGPSCLEYADLIAAIVGREESRELTPDYYITEAVIQRYQEQKQTR